MIIYTVGHSTRTIDEFIALLKAYRVKQLVDIRTIPKSRHNPQFVQDNLRQSLPAAGIDYQYMEHLGGLRHVTKDSINTAWRNASFRGYADYMQTNDFTEAIARLIACSNKEITAIMCAEAVPWRCHRSMVGDALVVRGVSVQDIMSLTKATQHTLTSFARVDGARVYYPSETIDS